MFPLSDDINCKHWDEISSKSTASTPFDTSNLIINTTNMALGVAEMARNIKLRKVLKFSVVM